MGFYKALGTLALLYFLMPRGAASDITSAPEEAEVARAFEQFASELLCHDLNIEDAHRVVGPALQSQNRKYSEMRGESPDPNRFGSVIPVDGFIAGGFTGAEEVNPAPILDPNSIPKVLVFEPRTKPSSAPEVPSSPAPKASPSPDLKPKAIL